jgi:type IV pilus assembly protein PilW
MVGIVIAIICTIGMMQVFAAFEAQKRTTTNGSDAQQNGSFLAYDFERQIRTAGAGLTQGRNWGLWGCKVNYSNAAGAVLPSTAAFPAPFDGFPKNIFAVPVLAQSGGTDASGNAASDILQVIRGNSAVRTFKSVVISTTGLTATLDNAFAFYKNEYVLLTDAGGTKGCTMGLLLQDAAANVLTMTAAGTPSDGFVNKYVGTGYVFDLGTEPAFTLYGVDTLATSSTYHSLMAYDLLKRGTTPLVPVADGIVAIKVLYGVDDGAGSTVVGDNIVDEWVAPTGTWAIANLTPSPDTSAAQTLRGQIKAVRVAVVAISKLPERAAPASASSQAAYIGYTGASTLTLFGDAATALQFKITTDPQYRYKVFDTVIPVRNALVTQFY